jgi:hypothetical protein
LRIKYGLVWAYGEREQGGASWQQQQYDSCSIVGSTLLHYNMHGALHAAEIVNQAVLNEQQL